jgi:hypothetical protein
MLTLIADYANCLTVTANATGTTDLVVTDIGGAQDNLEIEVEQ